VLSLFNLGSNVTIDSRDAGVFTHDDADVTMIASCYSYVVVNIIATCNEMCPKCGQLMVKHILSGCDTVSYPFNKGKMSALDTLQAGDFPGLYQVLGEYHKFRPY